MSQAFLGIYTADGSRQLADWSSFVRSCSVTNGNHGYDSLTADIDIPFFEAFTYYNNYGPLRIIAAIGPWHIFEGRIDDPTQFVSAKKNESGLKITAFGAWVTFSDLTESYTALWSVTTIENWLQVQTIQQAGVIPERFNYTKQNFIRISPKKNSNQANTVFGTFYFEIPHSSSRQLVGISFDYDIVATDVNWLFDTNTYNTGFTSGAGMLSFASINGTKHGVVNNTFTACDIVAFYFYSNTARSPFTGEDGSVYVDISNIRLTTSNTNRLATALTAARTAGSNVTATVTSTAGMYVGQQLQINPNTATANASETVTVLSIGSATQFNATFIYNYAGTEAIRSLIVYPNEIISDVVTTVAALNPTQLSTSASKIQNQGVDLFDAAYDNATPADVINTLIDAGDSQTTPRQWVAMIYEDRQLIVRPRGSGRAWYIDADELEVQRSLSQLFNSVVVTYKDASGRKLRSSANDSASIARYGITRRKNVSVDTTLAVEATRYRDTLLASTRDPIPRVRFPINAIYDSRGNWHPLWMLRADDTVTIRNFPPTIGTLYDKIRTLVVTRVTYDLMQPDAPLDAELEIPLPNINVQLARSLKRG